MFAFTPITFAASATPSRFGLLCIGWALLLSGGCVSAPLYVAPEDGKPSAEIKVNLFYSSKNFYEAFWVRGVAKCNPVPGVRLLQPVIEEPAQVVAVAKAGTSVHVSRLPANQPVPLRFTYQRVTETLVWDFVVVLEAGQTYEASRGDKTGVRVVNTATQAEAQRLPHNWLHQGLACP